LTLAKAEAPSLSAMHVTGDGTLQELGQTESRSDKHHAGDGEVILIAQILGLLIIFIGETLTLRLVQVAWPEAGLDSVNSGDETTA
jgi:hypothetical protein